MVYQVLNGDSLAHSFPPLEGEVIVVREGLVDGPVGGEDLWRTRADYIGVSPEAYRQKVVLEFEKMLRAPEGSTFHLWFEYDLFCQVNMWFVLSLLQGREVFAVYTTFLQPGNPYFWNGFGPADAQQLRYAYEHRVRFDEADLRRGWDLWEAYRKGDLEGLRGLSENSASFPYLREVVQAHLERFPEGDGRPERVLREIMGTGPTDFDRVFAAFRKTESIYGFGDVQVRKLHDQVAGRS